MKHFDLIGLKSRRVISIQDDEMLEWNVIKIEDYNRRKLIESVRKGARQ